MADEEARERVRRLARETTREALETLIEMMGNSALPDEVRIKAALALCQHLPDVPPQRCA